MPETVPPVGGTLYLDLVNAECEIDNHESDLHVKVTSKSAWIVHDYATAAIEVFKSNGEDWFDVPFAYDPFWHRFDNRNRDDSPFKEQYNGQ